MTLPRLRFTTRRMMIAVSVSAFLLFLLQTIVIRPMQVAALDPRCKANLRAIGLALQAYHTDYGCYPPAYTTDAAGRPMHSWRALILNHLGEHDLFKAYRFDEAWNGPHNSKLSLRTPEIYQCPAHSSPGRSSYAVVVGTGTAFPGSTGVSNSQITDRKATLVVELEGGGIPWLEPRDLRVQTFPTSPMEWNQAFLELLDKDLADLRRQGLAGPQHHPHGANFLFSPTEVEAWRLPEGHGQILRSMLTIDGGEIWYKDDIF
jgi:hypothetical protein